MSSSGNSGSSASPASPIVPLKFEPMCCVVDPGFWTEIARLRIDHLRLQSIARLPARGIYSWTRAPAAVAAGTPAQLILTADALKPAHETVGGDYSVTVHGTVVVYSTMKEFKEANKLELINAEGAEIARRCRNAENDNPEHEASLQTFLLLVFPELKQHKFTYWAAHVAVLPQKEVGVVSPPTTQSSSSALCAIDGTEIEECAKATETGAFLIREEGGGVRRTLPLLASVLCDSCTALPDAADGARAVASFECRDLTLCIADPSCREDGVGWPVRNLLFWCEQVLHPSVAARVDSGVTSATVVVPLLCVRHNRERGLDASVPLRVQLTLDLASPLTPLESLKCVGWERNRHDKLSWNVVDLGALMDPERLAEQGAMLNLSLMRWRQLPSLELEHMHSTKCLLIGAGTLGCEVARALLGWGFRHITFVDSGRVHYNNPVRQCLYTHADCVNGGRFKAEAAADALRSILPTVNSVGHVFSIPMPGHVFDERDVRDSYARLDALVREHDVLFLLLDSREARWLPTLLGNVHDKMVIGSALGFETFVVMRHGSSSVPCKQRVGCYFCSDPTAPRDSMSDRTLDQQCTVTRPGGAPVAGSLAVELLVSLLHHPLKHRAGADVDAATVCSVGDTSQSSVVGLVPHQIRGSLGLFSLYHLVGQAHEMCIACSSVMVERTRSDGIEFVLGCLRDSESMEELTGLAEVKRQAERMLQEQQQQQLAAAATLSSATGDSTDTDVDDDWEVL